MAILDSLIKPSASVSNEYIDKWRADGGGVVAYFCSYVPEELIHAAGLLPLRIRATGSTETDDGDAYLSNFNCSYARHALDMIFKGGFDFVDGIVGMNSCDHIRRLYDIIDKKAPRPFMHFLNVSHLRNERAVGWYLSEISKLKASLEDHFGVEITDEKLSDSIRLLNDTRRLLRTIHETRKRPNPPISGSEMLGITVSATAMPKEELNRMLREFIEELDTRPAIQDHKTRIMLVAGLLDDPEFLKVIEEQGALIVTESLCFGTRYYWNEADEALSPMEALAERYMNHPPCPRMINDSDTRFEFVKRMAEEYDAEGIICERMKFCDLWAGESVLLRQNARTADIPLLVLDKEYTRSGLGQLKTRVQAFIESMKK